MLLAVTTCTGLIKASTMESIRVQLHLLLVTCTLLLTRTETLLMPRAIVSLLSKVLLWAVRGLLVVLPTVLLILKWPGNTPIRADIAML